ncbi:MAG: hypothetical protein JNM31_04965 [Flavobacteriales bacterium]|nr:hypothetical protein [Flavobacteriales bacterium]
MRIATFCVATFLFNIAAQAQEWYCKNPTYASNPSGWTDMVAFEAGGKGYFGLGVNSAFQLNGTLYQYDPATNTIATSGYGWGARSQCVGFSVGGFAFVGLGNLETSDGISTFTYVTGYIFRFSLPAMQAVGQTAFPGGPRKDAISFTLGNKAYVGGGVDVDTTLGMIQNENDLWEYDPVADSWITRADMPANVSKGMSFVVAGKGYVMPDGTNTLWEYDPVANTWTTRAPMPGSVLNARSAFSHLGKGYVGCGSNTQGFQAYDPVTNSWSTTPPMWAIGGREAAVTFSIGGNSYVVAGRRNSTYLNDVWMFGPATTPAPDSWTQRPWMPAGGGALPIAFSIGNMGYVGAGTGSASFWTYDPATRIWTPRAPLPGPPNEAFSIDGLGYLATTAATGNFFAYDPVSDSWSPRADLPGGARSRSASFAMEGKGYVGSGLIGGVRQSDLWAYDPTTNSWTQCADRPGSAVHSASGFAIGNKGYMGGGNLGGSSAASGSLYRYDPVTNTWTGMGSLPLGNKQCAQAFVVGNKAYLGGGFTGGPSYLKRFDVYDPATQNWTLLGDMGGCYRYDGVGFSIADKGYLFGGSQNFTTLANPPSSGWYTSSELWEFNPPTVAVAVRAFLEGPFDPGTGLMSDVLRTSALLPATDPYGANGYPLPGGVYSDLFSAGIPPASGNNAVVDRIIVELRDATTPSLIKASRHAWVQRDGDVVDMDGVSPVRFTMPPGSYQVAVRHRNHLGAMTATPVSLSGTPAVVDLTQVSTSTYGTDARKTIGSALALWAGDVTFNGQLKYTGSNNDRDPILLRIGGSTPTNTVAGYFAEDVNMNGVVSYTGTANDRDPILVNINGAVITNTRTAQLP